MPSYAKIFRRLAALCCALFSLSGCSSTAPDTELPLNDKAETTVDKIKAARASNQTFSQRRLLEVVEAQENFMEWFAAQTDKSSGEVRTRAHRVQTLWNSYLADNPNDVDALIIYAKFRRATGSLSEAYKIFKRIDSIDGNIPVVKQQLATFEGESGSYKDAYSHLKLAVQLDPDQPVYHSQMGQLLFLFRDDFVSSGMFDRPTLDKMFLESFKKAYLLAPEREDYKWRYAQSFYDVSNADWNEPLKVWNELLSSATLGLERETVNANRARVLIELYRDDEAEKILNGITHPSLQGAKSALLEIIKKDRASSRNSEAKILKQMGGGRVENKAPVRGIVNTVAPAENTVASPHEKKKQYTH